MDWGVRRPPPPQWDWDDHPTPLDPRKLPGSPPPEFWAAEDGALWSPGNLGRCAASPSNVPAGRGVEESSGGSSEVVVSVCSGSEEPPPIGLKLGRRTYFGDPDGLSDEAGRKKKGRGTQDAVRCQVEGCDLDLTGAKEYHRKHKVCDGHSKSPRVVVAGRERRFCQQCSRFHDLSEFDQKKRSCRRRLSDHNARRRKPPPEMISFSSARSYTSFYDGAHQMNFLCNRSSFSYPGSNAAAILRGSSSGLRLQEPRELSSGLRKPDNACFGQRWVSADELSSSFPTFEHGLDKFFPPKVFSTEIVSEGTTTSAVASKFNGVPDTQCALSLLSNDSRGLGCPEHPSVLNHIVHTNNSSVNFTAIPENSDNWIAEFPSGHDGRKIPVTFYSSSSQHEGFQLPKSAHDATPFDPCHIHLFE